MNRRIAKQLRKDATTIAKETFGKTTSVKLRRTGGQLHWERYSPKAIYKALKKAHKKNIAPIY